MKSLCRSQILADGDSVIVCFMNIYDRTELGPYSVRNEFCCAKKRKDIDWFMWGNVIQCRRFCLFWTTQRIWNREHFCDRHYIPRVIALKMSERYISVPIRINWRILLAGKLFTQQTTPDFDHNRKKNEYYNVISLYRTIQ